MGRSAKVWMWLGFIFGPLARLAVALPSIAKDRDGLTMFVQGR
jgi:hypothetical protein